MKTILFLTTSFLVSNFANANLIDLGDGRFMLHVTKFAKPEELVDTHKDKKDKVVSIKFDRFSNLEAAPINTLLRAFPHVDDLTFWATSGIDLDGLDNDLLDRISSVSVVFGSFSAENLAHLARSKNFKRFSHGQNSGVESEGELEVLRSHPTIEQLSLAGEYTTDVFELLKTMPKLQSVKITVFSSDDISSDAAQTFYKEIREDHPDFNLKVIQKSGDAIFESSN